MYTLLPYVQYIVFVVVDVGKVLCVSTCVHMYASVVMNMAECAYVHNKHIHIYVYTYTYT
jgi:hypothetical protein